MQKVSRNRTKTANILVDRLSPITVDQRSKKRTRRSGGETVTHEITYRHASSSIGNLSNLRFSPLYVYEAFHRCKAEGYSKERISALLSFARCLQYIPEYKDLLAEKKEHKLPELETQLLGIATEIQKSAEVSLITGSTIEIRDVEYPDSIVYRSDHWKGTGALFLSEYKAIRNKDRRHIAFQAINILVSEFGLLLWDQTRQWDQIEAAIKNDGGEYNDDEFSKRFIKVFNSWKRYHPLYQQLRHMDENYEDLYDLAYTGTDAFALWLKAILYLKTINFHIDDYSWCDDESEPCTETYTIMPEYDVKFIDQYDSYINTYQTPYCGIVNESVITPDGIVKDNFKLPVADMMELVFSYNPKKNTFYEPFISDDRIETYDDYLGLHKRQRDLLFRVSEGRKRPGRGF